MAEHGVLTEVLLLARRWLPGLTIGAFCDSHLVTAWHTNWARLYAQLEACWLAMERAQLRVARNIMLGILPHDILSFSCGLHISARDTPARHCKRTML